MTRTLWVLAGHSLLIGGLSPEARVPQPSGPQLWGRSRPSRGSPRQWRVFWGQLCNTLEGLCKKQHPEPHRAFVCPSVPPDIAEDKRGLREEPEGLGSPGDPQRGAWGFSALLGTHRVRVLALLGIHREAQPAGLCVLGAIICLSFPSPFFCLHPPPALPAASGADLGSPPPHFSHLFPALPRQTPVGGRLGGSWETRSTKGGAGLRGHCQPPRAGAPQPVPALLECVPVDTCTHTWERHAMHAYGSTGRGAWGCLCLRTYV